MDEKQLEKLPGIDAATEAGPIGGESQPQRLRPVSEAGFMFD
ncbi:hypothetical protein [Rhizobium yanglingense]